MDAKVLDDVFEMWWPQLQEKINKTINDYKEESHEGERSERDILEELLELTRMTARRIPRNDEDNQAFHPRAIDDLLSGIERLLWIMTDVKEVKEKELYYSVRECFEEELFPPLRYLCRRFGTQIQRERLESILTKKNE